MTRPALNQNTLLPELSAKALTIDARGKYYKVVNEEINQAIAKGVEVIKLINVNGQRYIGNALPNPLRLLIYGTPGNNLGAFMNGAEIFVFSNAQEQVANTMNKGKILIFGDASDVVGYGMRGGKVFIKGDAGYRVGIHMKEYKASIPVIVVGGTTGDFLGEYMAGGRLIVLGLNPAPPLQAGSRQDNKEVAGDYLGTGMHGGVIYIRGQEVPPYRLGAEPARVEMTDKDQQFLRQILKEYATDFQLDFDHLMSRPFYKYVPLTHRPYGRLYVPQF